MPFWKWLISIITYGGVGSWARDKLVSSTNKLKEYNNYKNRNITFNENTKYFNK